MHPYHVNRTLKEIFQETLQADNQKSFGFHIYTNVNITTFLLLIARYRTEDTQ